jgi:S-adenosylmethionine:tRNA ribosyltransferase-isomerase
VIAPGSLRPADVLDDFELPTDLEATTPPEMRGIDRGEVRLMVTVGEELRHRQFTDLVDELSPGDLLVVNDSATNAAAIDLDDSRVVHFSSDLPGGLLVVEIRGRRPMAPGPSRR